ncbi:FAD-binding oxidoreductase [Naasia lichenicola]|nr:FAD-binding oxidoreductase [Naasia lichenicola]
MTVQITAEDIAQELGISVRGPVLTADAPDYAAEVAAFNLAVSQHPLVAVGALDAEDVATVVQVARLHGWKVAVQTTGHGAMHPIDAQILISTRRLDAVDIDAQAKVARIGGGVRWAAVVPAAAEHGLLPITGSSPNVGVVGYLMGGGLGPLARSFGYSSDYVVGATVVSGTGEILEVSADAHPDLFWAIRGGKYELGIVTEIRVRLIELSTIYGGALLFGTDDIERVLRGWAEWTLSAPDAVTTSLLVAKFPDLDLLPPFLRGRQVAMLRFAYPGDPDEGARLAAPLRALATAEQDAIRPLASTDLGQIHNDPTDPGPSWLRGAFLSALPAEAASILLETFTAPDAPYTMLELRHYGGALVESAVDSAVGGRDVHIAMGFGGFNPTRFADLPSAADALLDRLEPWLAPETNINFTGDQFGARHPLAAWSDEKASRIAGVQGRYDPDGLFHWWDAGERGAVGAER